MGKSFSTILLAVGAFVMVAVGGFVIATTALGDDDDESAGSSSSEVSGEQHVYMTNLGMTWRSCQAAVASELDSIDGVLEHEVDYQSDFVEMRYDADQVSIDEIMDELEEIGYRPKSHRDASEEDEQEG